MEFDFVLFLAVFVGPAKVGGYGKAGDGGAVGGGAHFGIAGNVTD